MPPATRAPLVPDSVPVAGCSGTPLAGKLGIKEGSSLVLLGAPDGLLPDLPPGVVVRELVLPRGLVDNKVCAIGETWSGLRVVWREERRTVGQAAP